MREGEWEKSVYISAIKYMYMHVQTQVWAWLAHVHTIEPIAKDVSLALSNTCLLVFGLSSFLCQESPGIALSSNVYIER